RWTADRSLLGEGTHEGCRTSFDWLHGAACFAWRSWRRSAQTSVVRVERRADTTERSRECHCVPARCILRSAVGHATQTWRVTAKRTAQGCDTATSRPRLAPPVCGHRGRT